MDTYPADSIEQQGIFRDSIEKSATVAFNWALGRPDTIEYGNFKDLDAATQELVILELVEELYTYFIGELGAPTDVVDDIFNEAQKNLEN